MKSITSIIVLLVLLNPSISAQQNEKGIDIQVNRFEKVSDAVVLNYKITTDKQAISNCESIFLHFFMKKDDRIVNFDSVLINGSLRKHSIKRQLALKGNNKKHGALPSQIYTVGEPGSNLIAFDSDFSYDDWMNGAYLYAKQIVWSCGANTYEQELKLAQLIVPEPDPIPEPEPEPLPEPEPEPVAKEVFHKEGTAYIDFPIGKSIINIDFGVNRKELIQIGELISEVNKNPDAKITGLEITGYASPDGPYAINDRLSRERAQALSEYINNYYKLNLAPTHIYIKNVAEDWEGLTDKVEESNLSEKDEILNIIRTIPSFDEREQALMRLGKGKTYETLKTSYFPILRRTEYRILYEIEE